MSKVRDVMLRRLPVESNRSVEEAARRFGIDPESLEPREWTPKLFGLWGALVGKTQALTKTFRPALPEFTRPDWQEEMRENELADGELDSLPDLLRRRHLSVYLGRVADSRVKAMFDEEQAAIPPYRSVVQQGAEILDDGF